MLSLSSWLRSLLAPMASSGPDSFVRGAIAMAEPDSEKGGGAATVEPQEPETKPRKQSGTTTKPVPKKPPAKELPPYKVLLHNDDKNTFEHVILTLVELTPLDLDQAVQVTFEADKAGVALVLVTHKERAELYVDQFKSKSLTVTIEPAK